MKYKFYSGFNSKNVTHNYMFTKETFNYCNCLNISSATPEIRTEKTDKTDQ